MSDVVLLGPQRLRPTLRPVVESLGLTGKIAAVTAGWQERETEDDELIAHLGRRTVNLRLYGRAEEVFEADADLRRAHRERTSRLRRLRGLYGIRLDHALDAARMLLRRPAEGAGDGSGHGLEDLLHERDAAVESIRRLDAHHLDSVQRVHEAFETTWRPRERASVARHRAELTRVLEDCDAIAIAGGHVAVLLSRLRLFGVLDEWTDRPIIAWSAGAMVLADRIVLFHDGPPQGPGNAEVFETGLGRCPGILPLPHARRRLRLDDALRVGLFARRFAPLAAIALDDGAQLTYGGGAWTLPEPVPQLTPRGAVAEIGALA